MFDNNQDWQRDKQKELDDFWDVSSLVVKEKKKNARPQRFDTSTQEIEIGDHKTLATQEKMCDANSQILTGKYADQRFPISSEKMASLRDKKRTPEAHSSRFSNESQETSAPVIYQPDHPLIEKVTLHPWRNNFPYYERFCKNAKELFRVKGERCDAVPFFSYMPQYDQMNRSQLAWYLYWRELIRKGEYCPADHSYIFLLIFEIINLPDDISPKEGIDLLCRIWLHYRQDYPLLDRYLCEWICDYCLLYNLPVPIAQLGKSVKHISSICQLREFYVSGSSVPSDDNTSVYLNCCSNYDYKKSRAYTSGSEMAAVFDRHIPAALEKVLHQLTPDDSLFSQVQMQTTTVMRDTFVGAICSKRIKYKLEVQYRSFSRSHGLRFLITDIVKYSENKLRAAYGYKSRLSIYALPDAVRETLNQYFASEFPRFGRAEAKASSRPDYEKQYDLPSTPLSIESASQIEADSWDTTKRLVEAFEPQETSVSSPVEQDFSFDSITPIATEQTATDHSTEDEVTTQSEGSCFSQAQLSFLNAALNMDVELQQKICRMVGGMPEIMADEINEIAVDIFGDILLEEDNRGFAVIEDYRDYVASLDLPDQMKNDERFEK